MKIALLVVGKTTDNHLQNCIAEYFKRLTHYIPFEIQIIPELKNTKGLSCEVQREKEGVVLGGVPRLSLKLLVFDGGALRP